MYSDENQQKNEGLKTDNLEKIKEIEKKDNLNQA
jgi:hypothetical protein